MAVGNVRALTLKKNAAEFEEKLSDIKRLIGALKSFIKDALSTVRLLEDTIEASDEIGPIGPITVRFAYHKANRDVTFEVTCGFLIDADRKYSLRGVRQIHDNLDVLIELAESICADAGAPNLFAQNLARFDVK